MQTIVEYVWLGGNNDLHSKTRILEGPVFDVDAIPEWNYDGSSTAQAEGFFSEIVLKPCRVFRDPFRSNYQQNALLVMCSTYNPDGTPHSTNHRHMADIMFSSASEMSPWFGMEQEYFISKTSEITESETSGHYYCSVGTKNAPMRNVADEHLKMCLNAGIKISGINAEVERDQWEYQIGPCVGIEAGDHLWMARYLMERVAEHHGVIIDLDPKPLGNLSRNGSGCHVNYSTKAMRERGGMADILQAIKRLEMKHFEHMNVYGKNNKKRLTGKCETANFETFSYGVGDRGASVRIGTDTHRHGCGYFEDRRPGSNIDPYIVTSKIFETTTGADWKSIFSTTSSDDDDENECDEDLCHNLLPQMDAFGEFQTYVPHTNALPVPSFTDDTDTDTDTDTEMPPLIPIDDVSVD